MQKHHFVAALAALACTAAFAQAPNAGSTRPPSEVSPTGSGGPAAANAQNKVDNRGGGTVKDPTKGPGKSTPPAEINPSASGGAAAARAEARLDGRLMDTNGDGIVSRQEWDAYHSSTWSSMNPNASGLTMADIEKYNRAGGSSR